MESPIGVGILIISGVGGCDPSLTTASNLDLRFPILSPVETSLIGDTADPNKLRAAANKFLGLDRGDTG